MNGSWPFNTGNFGASWTVVNALRPLPDGDGAVPTCVVVPCRDLTALDDWHASGMAATGSCTVVAEEVFVPEHRTYPLPLMIESQYPADRHNATNPYFNLPLATMLIVNAAGTPGRLMHRPGPQARPESAAAGARSDAVSWRTITRYVNTPALR